MFYAWKGCMQFLNRVPYILLVVFLLKPVVLRAEGTECEHRSEVCHSVLRGSQGYITSPHYPLSYPNHTCCSWTIDISAGNILVLRVQDLDIEEDPGCKTAPCCHHSWLSLPQKGTGSQKLCGQNGGRRLVVAWPPKAIIKFYTSKMLKGGRGFNLTYTIEREASACVEWANHTQCQKASVLCFDASQRCDGIKECPLGTDEAGCNGCGSDEFLCLNGDGCYTQQQLCDGNADCVDFSDEINCGYCPDGWAACSAEHRHCIEMKQRCDGRLDCPCGEDEVNCNPECPGKIACANGNGCFTPSELHNAGHMCLSSMDVEGSRLLGVLTHSKFRCDNGQCISSSLWCDGEDNCGDNSDEERCIKNSVITAAIMGALTCGLLLVVAVGCMCRLYSGRLHAATSGPGSGGPGRGAGRGTRGRPPLPPPPPPEALYGREPPPAYSVAVAEADYQQLTRLQPTLAGPPAAASEGPVTGRAGGGRRARRHGGLRRAARPRPAPPATPAPAVPTTLETSLAAEGKRRRAATETAAGGGSACSSSASSSLSPSRDSLTSSTSLLSYLSGAEDDAPLLVISPS